MPHPQGRIQLGLPLSFHPLSSILHHLRLAGAAAVHRPADRPELLEGSACRLAPGGSLSLFARAPSIAQDGMAAGSTNAPSGAPVELGPGQPGTQCCCSCSTGCCCCAVPIGNCSRCCSNCRPGSRGSSPMAATPNRSASPLIPPELPGKPNLAPPRQAHH